MARRGRIPKPWYRESTGTWYVTLGGRQVSLGGKKREAHEEFARLMAEAGRPVSIRAPTVGQLADLWLADRRRTVKPITHASYERILATWSAFAGSLRAEDLRPYHVGQWLDGQGLNQSTRHLRTSLVKAVTRWAAIQGYLARDPLAGMQAPAILRRSPVTMEQFDRVLDASPPATRELLTVLVLTGIRPGELASLSLERIDLAAGVATVDGKAGRRVVQLGTPAVDAIRAIAAGRTAGPLWPGLKSQMVTDRIRYAAAKAGVPKFSPHRIRGLFATEAIRRGVDSLLVSKLLGHKDLTIVGRHYASPDSAMLRDAADRATTKIEPGK